MLNVQNMQNMGHILKKKTRFWKKTKITLERQFAEKKIKGFKNQCSD